LAKQNKHIVVFEHEIIRWDIGSKKITKEQFHALEKFYGNGVPYFSLRYNGVQFNEHVGVIQVGNTLIEVLPKADNFSGTNTNDKDNPWRSMLINMMRAVGNFNIKTTSESQLKIKPNSILDLYFYMFIQEVAYLLHTGLIKKYRTTESNVTALKGTLLFAKQIQKNIVHQERFYVKHTVYDTEHLLHQILYKALLLIKHLSNNTDIIGKVNSLLLHFPEMQDIKISETLFAKIVLNRKSMHYKKALDIAKLILLQYHPDVSKGKNDVLALMFDMNVLWEEFVFVSLKKNKINFKSITAQAFKYFWKPIIGRHVGIRPDILIETNSGIKIVLDTKWKNLDAYRPSSEDLRQMYVYHEYYNAEKVALVYPSTESKSRKGNYYEAIKNNKILENKECSLMGVPVVENIKQWQAEICKQVKNWMYAEMKSIQY
jgi:5-methylcytosine-specific restriction enzyme subunit McrC